MIIYCSQGNQCKNWLNKAEEFRDKVPMSLKKYATCLMDLGKVVSSSFGNVVKEGWRQHIKDFKESYRELEMTWTPSIHGIVTHIEDWYSLNGTARGLGWYSEQATEHAHTAWTDMWVGRRFARDHSHPDYAKELKSAMAKFNAEHQ